MQKTTSHLNIAINVGTSRKNRRFASHAVFRFSFSNCLRLLGCDCRALEDTLCRFDLLTRNSFDSLGGGIHRISNDRTSADSLTPPFGIRMLDEILIEIARIVGHVRTQPTGCANLLPLVTSFHFCNNQYMVHPHKFVDFPLEATVPDDKTSFFD